MNIITRARLTGLAGAATAVVLAATSLPAPAYAAETPATLAEKAAALRALGLEPTPTRTGYKDCDLTVAIWEALDGQEFRGEVRTAAVSAFSDPASLSGDASKCTLFIRTEVFAAKQRDVAIQVAAEEQNRIERELKQKAALTIGLTISTDDLGLTVKNFVDLIRKSDKAGTRVKAGAQAAYDAAHADQLTFLGDGIVTAHEADREEQIRIEAANDEALRLKLIEEAARKRALAVLLVAATDGMLAASDRDFITYIWENAAEGTEVRGAAERAVLSREPADWNAYIHTGIHEAREIDRQRAARKKYEADVAKADALITAATENGHLNVVHAARKALAGTAEDLDLFIRVGQYDLQLTTGLEANEVGLTWSNSPTPKSGFVNVDGCMPLTVRVLNAQVARADAEVTRAEMDLEQLEMQIENASTAAERAKLVAKVPGAKKAIADAKAKLAEAKAEFAACKAKKPELGISTARARTGGNAVRVIGNDLDATRSFAYFQALNLDRIVVKPTTKLTYWIFPSNDLATGGNGTCVAVDLMFSNGANLRDSGAVDQNGNRAHPSFQCGKLKTNEWNEVTVPLGALFNGRSITRLDIAYDQAAQTGGFGAHLDDISITH
ncbi:hypothetical protein FHR83_000841 [Actinoplanes campanulatus]|uniref:Alpha-L-arabinofuranosidase B (ABFB) domain-containing protein n=1 Tax=Actinoplanes campanulatus TaxID=113559 RepID=A0A7W5FCE6_9ACTN|nr:hypothetical protein [Actinoplanes campanulatus]MBB3093207.1 hypothetical protein [Actinoplanes campanulatus]GGN01940.1 hypothetical protein GCM10010109_07690 [Actinoplanes campanulatus]GID33697.1 hypothetical protein Aca09nite_02030 [Actinoplanes campanulatus]